MTQLSTKRAHLSQVELLQWGRWWEDYSITLGRRRGKLKVGNCWWGWGRNCWEIEGFGKTRSPWWELRLGSGSWLVLCGDHYKLPKERMGRQLGAFLGIQELLGSCGPSFCSMSCPDSSQTHHSAEPLSIMIFSLSSKQNPDWHITSKRALKLVLGFMDNP